MITYLTYDMSLARMRSRDTLAQTYSIHTHDHACIYIPKHTHIHEFGAKRSHDKLAVIAW